MKEPHKGTIVLPCWQKPNDSKIYFKNKNKETFYIIQAQQILG